MKPFLFCLSAVLMSLPVVGGELPCHEDETAYRSQPYKYSYQYNGQTKTGTYYPPVRTRRSWSTYRTYGGGSASY